MISELNNGSGTARKTVLFSGHDLRFLRPFIAYCQRSPRYNVLLDEHKGHEITNPAKCRDLLPKADVIFCEWCLGNAVWYSQHKLAGQVLIIRLHLQEMQLPYLDRIRWDNVNALVLICPLNYRLIQERFPFLNGKLHLIYNPIDSQAFDQPKLPGAEFNLGIMGISPMRKGLHLAFEIFSRLKAQDSRFTLFVKGKHPREYDWLWRRPEERAYYERLFANIEQSPYVDSVIFETYGEDVPLWFSKIGFILSTSDFEGSHQSVAEGMASGAIPIIRNWPGSELLYPPKYIVRSVEEAASGILRWKSSEVYGAEEAFCRAYARDQFDQHGICQELEALVVDRGCSEVTPSAAIIEQSPPQPRIMVLGYIASGSKGGYRIRIEQEVRALLKHGCEVQLACLHAPKEQASALRGHQADLERLGCRVHLVPFDHFFDINLHQGLVDEQLRLLEQISHENNIDVVHAEALYCTRVGLLLKQLCPELKLVFDCHGATPEEEELSGAHPARIKAMSEWERRALVEADLNVFVSQAMRDYYVAKYGLGDLRCCLVPCCVADDRFAANGSSPRKLELPNNRSILAYLGTMAAWQCGEEMIRLFGQLYRADAGLFFLLLVPRADHSRTQELILKHGLPPENVLLTELPHHQVVSALQHACAGVLLRHRHPVNQVSSPTKFGEYLAAGIPVIMTDGIGDFSSIAVKKSVGLVFDAGVLGKGAGCLSQEVSRILNFVRQSSASRHEMSSHCQRVARESLLWDAAIPPLIKRYRELAHAMGVVSRMAERSI